MRSLFSNKKTTPTTPSNPQPSPSPSAPPPSSPTSTPKDQKPKEQKPKHKKNTKPQTPKTEATKETKDMNTVPDVQMTNIKHTRTIKDCPISHVTVYQDRAEVTRNFNLEIEIIGIQDVVISGFVPTVDQGSFRVSGGLGGAVILEVSYEEINEKPVQLDTQLKAKEIESALEDITNQITDIDRKIYINNQEKSWLERFYLERNSQSKVVSLPLDNIEKYLAFYSSNLSRIENDNESLHAQKSQLHKKTEELNITKRSLQFPSFETQRVVTISLAATAQGKVDLSLSYVIPGSGWKSRYDARVNSAERDCRLHYLAQITNNSGEDWTDVQLSLSTASPSVIAVPDKLFPLLFDLSAVEAVTSLPSERRVPQRRLSIAAMSFPEKTSSPSLELKNVPRANSTTNVKSNATNVSYLIPRKYNIKSDNKPHKVVVTEIRLLMEFLYVATPSKSEYAFLKGKSQNNSDYHLLGGEMNVFMDDAYITTTNLKKTAPGEPFDLYLGTDPDIKVIPKPTFNQNTKAGLINKKTSKLTVVSADIINNKSSKISALVFLELPFSSDPNIKIKCEEPAINGENITIDTTSVVCWHIDILPGKKERVRLKYSVEYPEEKKIFFVKQDIPSNSL